MTNSISAYTFPPDFVWGVATAAAQIEGAANAEGKGESIWDRFCRTPGKIKTGETNAEACQHYERYREDFALMRRLGVKHHRMSIAWTRLFPRGRGEVNQAGVEFYRKLFAAMAAEGITPWVTLFHWDLPQALEDEGGWLARSTVEAFADYANFVVRTFRDQVQNWFTLNEATCFIYLGYGAGDHAPGKKIPAAELKQAFHHAMLAHGHGVAAVRAHGGPQARVGLVHNVDNAVPLFETEADIAAAQAEFAYRHAHLLGAVYHGRYTDEYLARHGGLIEVRAGDMELISQPTDFLGINVYSGYFVRATPGDKAEMRPYSPTGAPINPQVLSLPDDFPASNFASIKYLPQAMYWGLRHCATLYGPREFYIAENGVSGDDRVDANGECLDLSRKEYLRNYLISLHRALAEGLPVRGYFLWSWMDNFEWAEGYSKRFGLVHVDFATQRRTPKLSAHWYAEVMRTGHLV